MREELKQQVKSDIKNNKVMMYIKGTADAPMCGFSGRVVSVFKEHNVPFKTANILEDEELRAEMKEYSDWPTFPQVYINGEFVGGCDIIMELHETGELTKLLGK